MARAYTRDPLHPLVEGLFQAIFGTRPAERVMEADVLRASDPLTAAMFNIGAPTLPVEREITIPGPAGDLRALVFAPQEAGGAPLPVVVYFHGGGFVIMTPESSAKIAKRIAQNAGAVVISIDYRRAPEASYPAPLDDCIAAFRWVRAHAASLGGDPSRVAVGGESAGGNLAAATVLRVLADGDAPPAAAVLMCAWLDLQMDSPSFRAFGPTDALIDDVVMTYWRDCYTDDPAVWANPLASPLRGDLSAFPPACVLAGGIDPLCDEDVQFAEKLRAAGRDVELHEYAGMPHIWSFFPQLDGVTDVDARIGAFLRRVFGSEAILPE